MNGSYDDAWPECMVMLEWNSLDEMFDIKMDKDSSYNNGFVQLRNEASRMSKTVLYTKLQEWQRRKCIVM